MIYSKQPICRWTARPYRKTICCSIWVLMGKLPMCFFCSKMGKTSQSLFSSNSSTGSTRKLLLKRILTLLYTVPGRTTTLRPWECWLRWQMPPWKWGKCFNISVWIQLFQIQIQDEQDVGVGGEGAGEEVAEGGDQQAGQVGKQTGQAGQRC